MQDIRKIELKSIYVLSVFRFFGGIFLVIGIIIGLFGNIFKIDIMSVGIIRTLPFLSRFGPGIITGIIFGIIYGLSAGIVSSICALLYNFFAALLGGLRFHIKE